MARLNVKIFIVSVIVLVGTLLGCSNIGNDNDNKEIKINANHIAEGRKVDFNASNGVIQKPVPHVNDLAMFLNKYDCSMSADTETCYEKTRARLIQVTKELDAAESKIYKLKRSTGILRTH